MPKGSGLNLKITQQVKDLLGLANARKIMPELGDIVNFRESLQGQVIVFKLVS